MFLEKEIIETMSTTLTIPAVLTRNTPLKNGNQFTLTYQDGILREEVLDIAYEEMLQQKLQLSKTQEFLDL